MAKGTRSELIKATPGELAFCLTQGANTTLMVWADVDDDMADCNALKEAFWKEAQSQRIGKEQFAQIVFAFAKDRMENWIEFLNTGNTDESIEGPRLGHNQDATKAADRLATLCRNSASIVNIPPSLEWSCRNWHSLVARMKTS